MHSNCDTTEKAIQTYLWSFVLCVNNSKARHYSKIILITSIDCLIAIKQNVYNSQNALTYQWSEDFWTGVWIRNDQLFLSVISLAASVTSFVIHSSLCSSSCCQIVCRQKRLRSTLVDCYFVLSHFSLTLSCSHI
jgi:hypothetical protein